MNSLPILLIEDNPDDVLLTQRALKKGRFVNEVVVARDGAEALSILFDDPARAFAFVLLDLNLPKLNGFQVLERIRREATTRYLPVVILSSSREEEDLIRGYALGTNSFIRKPVDFEHFVEAVREVGIYWLALNEPPPRVV